MARVYRHSPFLRLANNLGAQMLVRFGLGLAHSRAVVVQGRRSGRTYVTPMHVLTGPDGRFIVSAFGETPTIKNLRAAGHTTLIRGRSREDVRLIEVQEADRVPFLRAYLKVNRRVTAYFDATADSPDAALAEAAHDHTVFRVEPIER